ncbi:DUF1488 family protein, partial [Shigella sonnei]|uniref:DUF1488 family protein n=1 Tax=Shigella sonnei TaxID=624 RepID=UPI0009448509
EQWLASFRQHRWDLEEEAENLIQEQSEDDVMIGAGSLVPQNKRLESGYLYLGSPVKQIRPLSDEEKAGLRYSANNYVKWKDEYLDQGNQTQP